jgi:uncharacterized protein with HEPN domain
MIADRIPALLWDARMAAERIIQFVAGQTLEHYLQNEMLQSAVERQFGIVGEALAVARRVDPSVAARLPELADIVAFRNILIHGYAILDNEKVWEFTQQPLQELRAKLEILERQLGED